MNVAVPPTTNGHDDRSILALLERIDRRLARLEANVDRLDAIAHNAPAALATMTDAFDAAAAQLGKDGVNIDERVRLLLGLLERLTAGDVAPALTHLLDRVAVLERAVAQAPATLAAVVDTLDAVAARAADAGFEIDAHVRGALELIARLTAPPVITAITQLIDAGLFAPRTLATLGRLAEALGTAGEETAPPVGAWGAFRALGDPDVQRVLGFLLVVAKSLGRALESPPMPFERQLAASAEDR